MDICINEEETKAAFGKMLMLKESMEASEEFSSAGAGENYKQGFIEGVESCIEFMKKAVYLTT